MEQIILNIIETMKDSFNFTFCITCNILIYLAIKFFDDFNGDKPVTTRMKRVITIICILVCAVFYYLNGEPAGILFNSAILAPVFWSWIAKPVIKKLGFDYKQQN